MSNQVVKLAPELLSNIIRIMKRTTRRRELTPLLLVCKYWLEVGQPIAWASLVLANSSLEVFIAAAELSNRVCTHIRVLSLHLHTIWPKHEDYEQLQENPQSWPRGANPKTAAQMDCLDRLATLMKRSMLGLRSFSLRIDKLPEGGRSGEHCNSPQSAWMRSGSLAGILSSLPQSCTALELDTKGRDDDPVYGFFDRGASSHLCISIGQLLPRLRHLRLRLGSICPSFLCVQTHEDKSELRTFTISLHLRPDSTGVEKCVSLLPEPARSGRPAVDEVDPEEAGSNDKHKDAEQEGGNGEQLQAALAKHLQMAVLANKFPKATRFQVVNLESSPSLDYSHVRQRNIIENETYILPFRLIDSEGTGSDASTFVARNIYDEQMVG